MGRKRSGGRAAAVRTSATTTTTTDTGGDEPTIVDAQEAERKALLRRENIRKLREKQREARDRGARRGGAPAIAKKEHRLAVRETVESLRELFAGMTTKDGKPHPAAVLSYAEFVKMLRSDPNCAQRLAMQMNGDKVELLKQVDAIVGNGDGDNDGNDDDGAGPLRAQEDRRRLDQEQQQQLARELAAAAEDDAPF